MNNSKHTLNMHFEEAGQGVPLLLIHGFPLSSAIWEPQLGALEAEGHLIAPDLRGFGQSAAISPPYSVDLLAEDCASLLDALEVDRPAVVAGHSMGGYIALAFARLFPERLGGLVLVSTRAGADSADGKAGRDKAIEDVQQNGVHQLAEQMHGKLVADGAYESNPELSAAIRSSLETASQQGVMGALAAMRDRPDASDLLSEIAVPALVIHGSEDKLIPSSEAEAMATALPDAQLELLEGVGHMPSLEAATRFNQILAGFLAKF